MNERRDVKTYQVIQKARRAVRRADANAPVEEHNYFLVHASARATSQFPATDPAFGVVKNDTVKVKREVQVYQWVETSQKDDEGHETRYKYTQEWKDDVIQ